jgi:hypothetical protein
LFFSLAQILYDYSTRLANSRGNGEAPLRFLEQIQRLKNESGSIDFNRFTDEADVANAFFRTSHFRISGTWVAEL